MEILLAWLLADFLSGCFHFIEDTFLDGPSRFELIDSIRRDNDLHHSKPGAMLKLSIIQNMTTTAPYAWTLSIISWAHNGLNILTMCLFFAGFANVVHRFSHMRRPPMPIKILQRVGLFASYDHHNGHHRGPNGELLPKSEATIRYCVMSCYLNPVLDHFGFWRLIRGLSGR